MGERKRDRGRRRVREQEKPVEQHPAEETRQSFSGFNAVLDFLVFRQHWGGEVGSGGEKTTVRGERVKVTVKASLGVQKNSFKH